MKVYKFGGASVRNADGVRNLRKIIDDEQNLFIIVSAMGKTTNALEKVFEGVQKGDKDLSLEHVAALREYHAGIIGDLWHGPKRLEKVDALFDELERVAVGTVYKPADAELWYDTIVAFGELVSTTIISEYLNYAGVANRWIDMRRCFLTEQRHKDAGVDLEASEPLLKNALAECVENIFIGQGFIGGAPDGTTTTLGREGSDYSAAVAAELLDAGPAAGLHAEQALGVVGFGGIEQAEHLGHGHHQIGADLGGQGLAVALGDLGVQHIQAVGDQLFVHGGQNAAMVDVVLHLIGVGQVIGVQHHAVALSRAAQQVIAGHIIVIRYPDNKVQTALADALFVVGEQCLGHPKVLRGLLLGDAALLAQQLDDTVEFHDFGLLSSGN